MRRRRQITYKSSTNRFPIFQSSSSKTKSVSNKFVLNMSLPFFTSAILEAVELSVKSLREFKACCSSKSPSGAEIMMDAVSDKSSSNRCRMSLRQLEHTSRTIDCHGVVHRVSALLTSLTSTALKYEQVPGCLHSTTSSRGKPLIGKYWLFELNEELSWRQGEMWMRESSLCMRNSITPVQRFPSHTSCWRCFLKAEPWFLQRDSPVPERWSRKQSPHWRNVEENSREPLSH